MIYIRTIDNSLLICENQPRVCCLPDSNLHINLLPSENVCAFAAYFHLLYIRGIKVDQSNRSFAITLAKVRENYTIIHNALLHLWFSDLEVPNLGRNQNLLKWILNCLPLCFLPMLEIGTDQVPIVSSVISEVKNFSESPQHTHNTRDVPRHMDSGHLLTLSRNLILDWNCCDVTFQTSNMLKRVKMWKQINPLRLSVSHPTKHWMGFFTSVWLAIRNV